MNISDYDKAMMHIELALRRACASIRQHGETSAEDALWIVAGHIAELSEEHRKEVSKTIGFREGT